MSEPLDVVIIDRYLLNSIYDAAHREMVNGKQNHHDSAQTHLTKCWTKAVLDVIKSKDVIVWKD